MTILAIVTAIIFFTIGLVIAYECGKDRDSDGVWWAIGAVAMAVLATIAQTHANSYRRGQIDAINGKVKFERVVNGDGESVWRETEKTK